MEFFGKSVFEGIAIGRIVVYDRGETNVIKRTIADIDAELARFEAARVVAVKQVKELCQKAQEKVGDANAEIFAVHQMMLEDVEYIEAVNNMIATQEVNAEFAVDATGENFATIFSIMDDEYMQARSADVKDISNRIVSVLMGRTGLQIDMEEPVIVLADDLVPSETVQLDKSKVLSFVTFHGSANSHTAILARMMNIPALVGVKYPEDSEGKLGIVDAYEGKLIIEPSKDLLEEYKLKKQRIDSQGKMLLELKGKENVTLDGTQIDIYANIGGVDDVRNAIENDAGGIGLFRSEFLYLESENYPTEEEQFEAYSKVAKAMGEKKVVIRTLDIGADKQVGYFNLPKEENPALGYRAIRICLDRVDVFKTQLRAIYRASNYGNIAVLLPMIISVEEVVRAKNIIAEVKNELDKEDIHYGDVELGVMIETPAAVMISDELGKEVDFLSIGTNDLTQYTLAIDRQNPSLDKAYDVYHPAILKMIEMVVNNGHKNGCKVAICGELGADTALTKSFIKMGVDELSVNPSMILKLRAVVRETDFTD